MGLEANFRYVDDLVNTNPTFNDPVSAGDDHLRGIKSALQGTIGGNATEAQLKLQGATRLAVTGSAVRQIASDDQPSFAFHNAADAQLGKIDVVGSDMLFNVGGLVRATLNSDALKVNNGALLIEENANEWRVNAAPAFRVVDSTLGQVRFEIGEGGGNFVFNDAAGAVLSAIGPAGVTHTQQPTSANHLTRKDYVDGLVAGLQAEINDIKNGYAFTGPISAPTVTQTT